MSRILYAVAVCAIIGCQPSTPPTKPVPKAQPSSALDEFTETEYQPAPIRVLAWNVESDGSDPQLIADQLRALSTYGIVCLSEVSPASAEIYATAYTNFDSVLSKTGRNDRLRILFDTSRFEQLEVKELHDLNNENHRSPMYVRLRELTSDVEFIVCAKSKRI